MAYLNDAENSEQFNIRLNKLNRIGEDKAYPAGAKIKNSIEEIRSKYCTLEKGQHSGDKAVIAGRVMHKRNAGKLCFLVLQDGQGNSLQTMFSKDALGEKALSDYKEFVDLGDILIVEGEIISSLKGELSILADNWRFASKSLRGLPALHKDLSEETRVRQRYLDLLTNENARRMVKIRAAVNKSIRNTLDSDGFIEIETPMLQTMHGGAQARPFKTYSNAYDADLYLRIAPELFLKRALVGGIHKVYEINRNFRNEGADRTHNPEFAMLEAYSAYGDYNDAADFVKAIILNAIKEISHLIDHNPENIYKVSTFDGQTYDFSPEKWQKIDLYSSLSQYIKVDTDTPIEVLQKYCDNASIKYNPNAATHGKLVEELFEHYVLPDLNTPTFVYDYPLDTSPLTRNHRSKEGIAEKWDLYIKGCETATGYSELLNPIEQRKRLVAQAGLKTKGDAEAMSIDEDFLRALEHGAPPSWGIGMGIDRLLMALTGGSVRETVLFPLVI